jgi:hypothetical protein
VDGDRNDPEREDDPQKVRKLSVSRGAGQRPAPVGSHRGAEILNGDCREQTLATAPSQGARRGRQLAHPVDWTRWHSECDRRLPAPIEDDSRPAHSRAQVPEIELTSQR